VSNPSVIVDFLADTSGLKSGFKDASNHANGFSTRLKSLAKGAAFAAGAAGVGALVYTLKTGISEFQDSQKVAAQTAAAIKSTGGAANVTSQDVAKLANALMKKSGIDDEAIQSGENLLLTFTRIRNETGRGNDIFNKATQTMTDMSVALGQDMKSSAVQLGKALNDPVKGVTALQRVGVSFTQGQKDQIKTLEATGHHLEAQKLVLRELNKEFGGSAEAAGKTLPGQLSILRESFNNFAGDLVAKLAPALQATIQWLRDNWPQISKVFQQAWAIIGPLLSAFGDAWVAVFNLIRDHWSQIGPVVNAVVAIIKAAATVIGDILKVITALLRGDWSQAWEQFKNLIVDVWNLIKAIITADITVIKTILSTAWGAIFSVASAAWNQIKQAITGAAQAVVDWVKTNWPLLLGILTGPFGLAVVAIIKHWDSIKAAINAGIAAVKGAFTAFSGWLGGIVSTIVGFLGKMADAFGKPAQAAQAAAGAIKSAIGGAISFLEGLAGKAAAAASAIADAIKRPINALISGWNSLSFTVPSIHIPSVKILGKEIGGGSIGGFSIGFPNIPMLAQGGVVSRPTLAMVGEGQGREIVTPEALLRSMLGEMTPTVHVFIGETELRGIVRTEVIRQDTRTAQVLLAGLS